MILSVRGFAFTACLLAILAQPAAAASLVIEAGKTHTLQENLLLNGDDVLEIKGTAEKPCTLVGNQHGIRSGANWTGSLRITHCVIQKLGGTPKLADNGQVSGPGPLAIDLKVGGKGSITIEHCTLDAC